MPRLDRQAILGKLQAMKKARQPVIGGGAGTGLSAKCEEAGGIDLNSGRCRMAGRGSLAGVLAHGNANEIVRDMAREVLAVVKRSPVLAGVGGPVAEPQDTEFILRSTERCHGFDGASSMERLPTERAMTDQTRRCKAAASEKASL